MEGKNIHMDQYQTYAVLYSHIQMIYADHVASPTNVARVLVTGETLLACVIVAVIPTIIVLVFVTNVTTHTPNVFAAVIVVTSPMAIARAAAEPVIIRTDTAVVVSVE